MKDLQDKELYSYYKERAEQGDSSAQFELGVIYLEGTDGVEQSYEKAAYWFEKAAKQDDVIAQYNLGIMYKTGKGVEQSYGKAVYWLEKSAVLGDDKAPFSLAVMYEEADGVEQSNEKAVYWYTKAATQGNAMAQYWLAKMYHDGKGVEQSYEKSLYWFEQSAKLGDAGAQCELGIIYYLGEGVEKSYLGAIKWFEMSAQQGEKCAQFFLAEMYRDGLGVKQSYEKAIYWFEESAKQRDSSALCSLGELYYFGCGVEQSYQKALKYFYEAVKGNTLVAPEAFYYLGDCYHNGFGVQADWQKAKEYYEKAIALGYNCKYALEMARVDLGEYNQKTEMRRYADSVLALNLHGKERKEKIEKDLAEEFGDNWAKLRENAQKALVSGIFSYLNFYELGEEIYKDMDFTPSITAMAKALEIMLAEYFFKGYVRYLKGNHISASFFDSQVCFLKVERDENGLELSREYRDENETQYFSLGAFYYIIDSKFEVLSRIEDRFDSEDRSVAYRKTQQYVYQDGKKIKQRGERTISKYMADYADLIFSEDAFNNINRRKEIVNYLVDLASDVFIIKKQRNPAAHGQTMSCLHAEVCGDYLVKVKKLICNFLEKVKG